MFGSNLIACTDGEATTLGYFDLTLAPELLYYSYVSVVVIALFLGTYVLFKNRFTLISTVLFLLTLFFSALIGNEILQWIVMPAGFMHFTYSLALLFQSLTLFFTLYFVIVFIRKGDLLFREKIYLTILLLPIILFLPSTLNLVGIVLETCTGVTGILWNYFYGLEVLTAVLFLGWAFITYRQYRALNDAHLLASTYLLIASSVFLLIFFASYFYADQTGIYEINLVGPLGMLIFIGVLSYLIVKFHAFNIRLLGAQALILGLVTLIGSQYFFASSTPIIVLISITLFVACIGGFFLVRSVKNEVQQKEQIKKLADNLQQVNERLKILDKMKSEFVSIASHQLRSPLTSIRGYASMLVEGSYGKLPAKAKEVAERIADSSKYMALSVEDYLNVSRIDAGNMKYEMSDFDLRELTERIVDELRSTGLKKGLVMLFRSDCDGSCMTHADIGKTRQIIMNLIDNSLKYTPKGTVTTIVHDDIKKKKIIVSIKDTGVGMSKETIDEVFEKFVRAKNANNVNVTGTGLGLFVAKKMIADMNGRVWAESEGEGKGSTFNIELPLLPGKAKKR